MVQRKSTYRILGLIIILISTFWLIKSGYHLIFYSQSGGLEKGQFSYPKDFWEVFIAFLFWIIMLIGGIGISKNHRFGLKIGLFSLLIGFLISMIYTIFIGTHRLKYVTTITNGEITREMTFKEKWNIIYSKPIGYALITLSLLVIMIFIYNNLRKLKAHKHG